MNSGNFFTELKRRNVYKVAVAYAVVSWLLIQIATQVCEEGYARSSAIVEIIEIEKQPNDCPKGRCLKELAEID
jgi:hypothetical protein